MNENFPKPICVFCNKLWSDDMVKLLDVSIHSCSSGGIYGGFAVLDITCDGCQRLIYRKEFVDFTD